MSKSGGSQEVLALRGRDLLSQPRKRVVRCDGRGDAGRSMLESPCHVRPLERPSRKYRRVSANTHRAAPFRAAMAETAALQQDFNFCSKNGLSIPSVSYSAHHGTTLTAHYDGQRVACMHPSAPHGPPTPNPHSPSGGRSRHIVSTACHSNHHTFL